MKVEITMPALRPEMKSGVLCTWCVKPGDEVKRGDVLFEVETDKVVSEIEAMHDMKIISLEAEEGDNVPVGQVVAYAEADGE